MLYAGTWEQFRGRQRRQNDGSAAAMKQRVVMMFAGSQNVGTRYLIVRQVEQKRLRQIPLASLPFSPLSATTGCRR